MESRKSGLNSPPVSAVRSSGILFCPWICRQGVTQKREVEGRGSRCPGSSSSFVGGSGISAANTICDLAVPYRKEVPSFLPTIFLVPRHFQNVCFRTKAHSHFASSPDG